MKAKIHPTYKKAKVKCACGNTFETISTLESIRVDICSECHPFYTGKQKYVDTAGRVEKFQRKYGWGEKLTAEELAQKTKKELKKETKKVESKKKEKSEEKESGEKKD